MKNVDKTSQIKNCPKCGGKAEILVCVTFPKGKKQEGQIGYVVRCKNCNCSCAVICTQEHKAIEFWNTKGRRLKNFLKRKYTHEAKSRFWKIRRKTLHYEAKISKKIWRYMLNSFFNQEVKNN